MNRSMLVASCLAIGWAPWGMTGAKAQTPSVVKEVDALIEQAAAKDQPPAKAAAQDGAAKTANQFALRVYQDEAAKNAEQLAVRVFQDEAAKNAKQPGVQLDSDAAERLSRAMADQILLSDGVRFYNTLGADPVSLDLGFPIVRHPGNSLLGATLNPVEDSVRAQLNIPAGQGLVVSTVSEGGACATVGLKSFDIIVSLADKPIGKSEDLSKALLELGTKTGTLKVLRAGKKVDIAVKPVPLVTMGVPANEPSDYFIGVSIDAVDEVLRKALQLADGKGVCITEVIADSPAEKAGFKKYDLITQIDGKPVDNADHLRATVQKAKARALKIGLIREGKAQSITVTPVVRKGEVGKTEEEQKDSFRVRFSTPLSLNDQWASQIRFTSPLGVNQPVTAHEHLAAQLAAAQSNQSLAALVNLRVHVEQAEKEKQVLQARLAQMQKEAQIRAEKLELEIRALKAAIDALNDKVKSKK